MTLDRQKRSILAALSHLTGSITCGLACDFKRRSFGILVYNTEEKCEETRASSSIAFTSYRANFNVTTLAKRF